MIHPKSHCPDCLGSTTPGCPSCQTGVFAPDWRPCGDRPATVTRLTAWALVALFAVAAVLMLASCGRGGGAPRCPASAAPLAASSTGNGGGPACRETGR